MFAVDFPEARTSHQADKKSRRWNVGRQRHEPAPAEGTSGVRYGLPWFQAWRTTLARVSAGKRVTPPLPILAVERRLPGVS